MLAYVTIVCYVCCAVRSGRRRRRPRSDSLDGESLQGRLAELSRAERRRCETAAGAKTIRRRRADVGRVARRCRCRQSRPSGSSCSTARGCAATSYTAADGKAQIELTTRPDRSSCRRGRFTPSASTSKTPELAVQWREITSSHGHRRHGRHPQDSMRTVEQGENEPPTVTEQALDQLEGTLLDVDARERAVRDRRRQDRRPPREARRARLLSAGQARIFAAAVPLDRCRRLDLARSRRCSSTADASRRPRSAASRSTCRCAAVAKIDFSVGNVAFSSDLEPDSGGGEPASACSPRP